MPNGVGDREFQNLWDMVIATHDKVDNIASTMARICEYIETEKSEDKKQQVRSGIIATVISAIIGILARVFSS